MNTKLLLNNIFNKLQIFKMRFKNNKNSIKVLLFIKLKNKF